MGEPKIIGTQGDKGFWGWGFGNLAKVPEADLPLGQAISPTLSGNSHKRTFIIIGFIISVKEEEEEEEKKGLGFRRERGMEGGGIAEDSKQVSSSSSAASYTYWVREVTQDAAPLPAPRKLSSQDISTLPHSTSLGSVWNRAGTWEEKNLNSWASGRIKELLGSLGSLEFSSGRAEIAEVSKCIGDAFLVTVRNKKRVGYTYELTLKIKGEWSIQEEKKKIKGHIDIPEFSFGEVDDLQVEVTISEEKDLEQQDKVRVRQDLILFLQPIREKLLQFEQELKDR